MVGWTSGRLVNVLTRTANLLSSGEWRQTTFIARLRWLTPTGRVSSFASLITGAKKLACTSSATRTTNGMTWSVAMQRVLSANLTWIVKVSDVDTYDESRTYDILNNFTRWSLFRTSPATLARSAEGCHCVRALRWITRTCQRYHIVVHVSK